MEEENESEEETQKQEEKGKDEESKDIKLGEIQLRDDSVLLIKKTNYKGNDRIDFRVWKNTPNYKGPTKQGFVVTLEKLDEFFKIVGEMKKKLGKNAEK